MFVTYSSDLSDLEKAISVAIRKKGLSFFDEFSKIPSAIFEEARGLTHANVIISKDNFIQLLHKLGLYTVEQDFVLFMA